MPAQFASVRYFRLLVFLFVMTGALPAHAQQWKQFTPTPDLPKPDRSGVAAVNGVQSVWFACPSWTAMDIRYKSEESPAIRDCTLSDCPGFTMPSPDCYLAWLKMPLTLRQPSVERLGGGRTRSRRGPSPRDRSPLASRTGMRAVSFALFLGLANRHEFNTILRA